MVNYDSTDAKYLGGYMTTVPSDWQSAFGGPALTGHCCTSIIGHQSLGPSAWVFDPDKLGVVDPVPSTPVVYYPIGHPTLGTWEGNGTINLLYNMGTVINGIIFPEGTRSVLFIGRTGAGLPCYDSPGAVCNDPANPYKGSHAYPYKPFVWAYDALDLLTVKSGQKKPWEILPYATWFLSVPYDSGMNVINGAAYDPATKRIYVSQKGADEERPVIHVYQLNATP